MQEKLGIGGKEVFKSASAFAGGIARQGDTCGALIGGIMAIELVIGREKIEDNEQYNKAMKPAIEMYNKFREKVGQAVCQEILYNRYGRKFQFRIPDDLIVFHEMGGHTREGCPEICGIAAQIAAEIILGLQNER